MLYNLILLWWVSNRVLGAFLILLHVMALVAMAVYYFNSVNRHNHIFNRRYLLGTWQLKGTTPEGEAWQFTYLFTENEFEMHGAPPEFLVRGTYSIVREVESLLTLEMKVQQEQAIDVPDFFVQQVAIDQKNQRITIDGRVYQKVADR